jgi:ABC-type oligopeptide transport system substrate-binding subunit
MVRRILYNRFFLLFAAAFLLFVNCLHKTTLVQKGIDEQILHIGNQVEPQDLDPQIITGVQEFRIVSALFEGLTILDPKDLHPLPGAAETWTVSSDGQTFTFFSGKTENGPAANPCLLRTLFFHSNACFPRASEVNIPICFFA